MNGYARRDLFLADDVEKALWSSCPFHLLVCVSCARLVIAARGEGKIRLGDKSAFLFHPQPIHHRSICIRKTWGMLCRSVLRLLRCLLSVKQTKWDRRTVLLSFRPCLHAVCGKRNADGTDGKHNKKNKKKKSRPNHSSFVFKKKTFPTSFRPGFGAPSNTDLLLSNPIFQATETSIIISGY